jgi:hypothetical protein
MLKSLKDNQKSENTKAGWPANSWDRENEIIFF